jgi:O-antigen biosynthesis protein
MTLPYPEDLFMSDEFRKTFDSLKKATDEHPDDGSAWLAFATFLDEESDNPAMVVRAYERAQELLPQKDLRLQLGTAYVNKGEDERGFGMLRRAAEERPRSEAFCFLSDACLRRGRAQDAEQAARRAIQLEPEFEEAYYLLGNALKNHRRDEAIDAYRVALSLDDKYALAWQALGRELLASGDIRSGMEALQKAVSLDSDDIWSHVYLANALWRLGRLDQADAQYRAAIALDPDSSQLNKWYEEFLDANNNERSGEIGDQRDGCD